jgi:hypothetical protein
MVVDLHHLKFETGLEGADVRTANGELFVEYCALFPLQPKMRLPYSHVAYRAHLFARKRTSIFSLKSLYLTRDHAIREFRISCDRTKINRNSKSIL